MTVKDGAGTKTVDVYGERDLFGESVSPATTWPQFPTDSHYLKLMVFIRNARWFSYRGSPGFWSCD